MRDRWWNILGGVGVTLALLAAGWWQWQTTETMKGVPVRTAAQLSDLADGTLVMSYGGVLVESEEPLAIYDFQALECPDVEDATRAKCTWEKRWHHHADFVLVMPEDFSQRVAVRGPNYVLTGAMRTLYLSEWERIQGFGVGDGVTVVGTAHGEGILASVVYSGTPDDYIMASQIISWICLVAGGVMGVIVVVAVVLEVRG